MSRFKTELCNNLIELGSCKYGDRCHYAHGAHELRQVSRRHPKYRTEKCKNFELTGRCPFGPRCSYVHPKPDLDSMIEQLTRYVQHTKAPKPDSEDDDDETNISNLFSRSATSSSLLSQCETSSTSSSSIRNFPSDDANKENQLVADCAIKQSLHTFNNSNRMKNEDKLNYIDSPFALNGQQPTIFETHKPLATLTQNPRDTQQPQPQLASSTTLTIQRPQQPQRIAMRVLSSNTQSQLQDQTEATNNRTTSSPLSSSSSSSSSLVNCTITASNPFGINNPFSDYFNTTPSNISEGNSVFPNKQFFTRF
jgi:hypothetical protein